MIYSIGGGDMNLRVKPQYNPLVLFHTNAGIFREVRSAAGCKPDTGRWVTRWDSPRMVTETVTETWMKVWSVVCSAFLCQSMPHLCAGKGFGGLSPIIRIARFEYQEDIVKLGQNQTEPQQQLLWTFVVFLWNNKVAPELQCQFFFPRQTLFPLSHSL